MVQGEGGRAGYRERLNGVGQPTTQQPLGTPEEGHGRQELFIVYANISAAERDCVHDDQPYALGRRPPSTTQFLRLSTFLTQ